jgi:TRAP-type C4-dicarboxylate transport system permease small subunit
MKRRTVARIIATVILAYGCAFLIVASDRQDMATYRSLSHEALLAKLAHANDGDFDSSFMGSFIAIGVVVICIEALATLVELIINRISPLPPTVAPPPDSIANMRGSHVG